MDGRRFVALCAVACLVLRFPSLLWPLGPDESGYFLVVQRWDPSAENLYGFYFVDRPPLLLGLYAVADSLGATYLPRLLAAVAAVGSVLVSARIGSLLGGDRAARWCAVVATALSCTPMLGTYQAKGEMLGLPVVLASCWLALESLGRQGVARLVLAAGAGMAGMAALGLKQSLYGGLVFGGVLLVATGVSGRERLREVSALALAALAGAAVPLAVLLAWAGGHGVALSTLWETLYSFRSDAVDAITTASMGAAADRVLLLVAYFVGSGIAVALVAAATGPRPRDRRPVAAALVGMVLADLATVVLGGAYWTSYLIPLVAGTVIAVALLRGRVLRWTGTLAGVSAVVSLAVFAALTLTGTIAPERRYAGQAIGAAAERGDTVIVVYGAADIVRASGLTSPYPYLWSLPVRVLDPDLMRMGEALTGADRVTWVAQPLPVDSWGMDDDRDLREALASGYRDLGEVCGVRVWLRSDEARRLGPVDCERPYPQDASGLSP